MDSLDLSMISPAESHSSSHSQSHVSVLQQINKVNSSSEVSNYEEWVS